MKPLIHICLFFLFIAALTCQADSIYAGAWSYHLNPVVGVNNQTHQLLAYERNSYVFGTFKNSFGDRTYIAGKEFELFEYGYIRGSVLLGVDYGYKECIANKVSANEYKYKSRGSAKACIVGVPSLQYTKYKLQPTFSAMGDALTLGIKMDFK